MVAADRLLLAILVRMMGEVIKLVPKPPKRHPEAIDKSKSATIIVLPITMIRFDWEKDSADAVAPARP